MDQVLDFRDNVPIIELFVYDFDDWQEMKIDTDGLDAYTLIVYNFDIQEFIMGTINQNYGKEGLLACLLSPSNDDIRKKLVKNALRNAI